MSDDSRPDDSGTAIAETGQPGTAIATVAEWDARAASVRTSLTCDDDASAAKYINALAGADAELQASYGTEMVVVDWLLHIREQTDAKTGEVTPALRLVLILEDGRRIAGGSRPVIEGWASVARLFGQRKPFPRLGVTLSRHKARGEGHYLQIANVRVMPANAKPPAK